MVSRIIRKDYRRDKEMIIFNIILYITIGFIVYFGYQTVLHYHKHENVNFLRGLIISTLVLAVLVSLQIYWALPNIIGLFLWLFIMFLFISVAASVRYITASLQDKKKRKIELIASAVLAVISLIALFIVVANVR